MKNKINILLIVFTFTIAACTKTINIKFPEQESKIVVNGLFNNVDTLKVFISKSITVLAGGNVEIIKNASVKLFVNNIQIDAATYNNNIQEYIFNTVPQIGITYTLKVEVTGYQSVEATGTIPNKTILDSFKLSTINNSNAITYFLKDDGQLKNYYGLSLLKLDSNFVSGIPLTEINFNNGGSGNPISGNNNEKYITFYNLNITSFTDQNFNGLKYSDLLFANLLYIDTATTNTIKISLYNFSNEAYLYLFTIEKQQTVAGNPFSEPVIVYNNIKNGLGIFAGVAVDTKMLKVN